MNAKGNRVALFQGMLIASKETRSCISSQSTKARHLQNISIKVKPPSEF